MSDPSKNFGDAATQYAAFRPDYPAGIFDALLRNLSSGRGCAVDLGAGAGQATRRLAPMFERVVAVEPDARLAASANMPDNVDLIVASAEGAAFAPDSIDAVISATAFHWMDQSLVCRNVARWLKPGGVFFPFAFNAFEVEGPAREYYAVEFEKWAAHRDRRLIENYDYESALRRSDGFSKVIAYRETVRRELTPEAAAGLFSTFSFARDYARTLNNADAYFQSVKDMLARGGGAITVTAPVSGAIGVKA